MSASRNDAKDKLERAYIDRTVAHGDQKNMKTLKKELEEITGKKQGTKGLDDFLKFAGKGF